MLFQELNKFKRSSIIASMILMTLGLAMTICPELYISSLINSLGYSLLILAIVMVLDYMSSRKVLFNTILLTLALVLGMVGLAVLVFKDSVLVTLGLAFGVALVLQGIIQVYSALMYVRPSGRRGWWLLTILAVILMIMGILILLNPWWDTPRALLKVIGITLLLDSFIGILRLVWIWPIRTE